LSSIALALGLNKYVLVGSNERSKGYHENLRLMSDVLESLIGALYLDGAVTIAEKIIVTAYLKIITQELCKSRLYGTINRFATILYKKV